MTRTNILHLDKMASSFAKGGFSHGKLKSGRTPSSCSFEVCRGQLIWSLVQFMKYFRKMSQWIFVRKIFRTIYIFTYIHSMYIRRRKVHILFCSTAILVHGRILRQPQVVFQNAFVLGVESWSFQIFPIKELQVSFF